MELVQCGGQRISVKSFLEQEGIIPNMDGEKLQDFESLYDKVEAIKKSVHKEAHKSNDDAEKMDLESKGWKELRKLKTDNERKNLAQT